MKKLSLKELNVTSFTTSLNTNTSATVKGGRTINCEVLNGPIFIITYDDIRCGDSKFVSDRTEC